MSGPDLLVWTRMQAEAGQGLARIVARKELERRLNGGTFLWGVGNAPSRHVRGIVASGLPLEVVFSVMLSKPKAVDANPAEVVAWTRIVEADGVARPVPPASVVTSRRTGRAFHYALRCRSADPLALGDLGPFDPTAFRNRGGGPVGASQVTSLIERHRADGPDAAYRAAMRAGLDDSMWTRLTHPVAVPPALRAALDDDHDEDSWAALASDILKGRAVGPTTDEDLFG